MKKTSILIVTCLLLVSCDNFLDPLPKGQTVAKTTSDFRKLLDNAGTRYKYSFAQTSLYLDVMSDDVQVDSTTLENWAQDRDLLHLKNAYQFESQVWTPRGTEEDKTWKNAYYISNLASNILNEIYKADDNKKKQKQLIAEAKVHRAYAYLTLINAYAKHYDKQTASNDLGVPIITDAVKLPSLERSSVQDVYDFILKDLHEAVEDLPDDVQGRYIHRPSKASTYAILARTYLYMADYEKALEYANRSLAINNFLYDYNNIYTGEPRAENVIGISRKTDKEMLMYKSTNKGAHLNRYMIIDKANFNKIYSGYQKVDPAHTENYDLRRTLWFEGITSNGQVKQDSLVYVFSDGTNHRYAQDNVSKVDYLPIATPEMYLTRAESNARLGHLQDALNDVNTIRQHRFKTGTYTNMTLSDLNNDQQNVLDQVLLERRRELYGKELRLFDVKRLHLPVTHKAEGQAVSIPANDPKLVWPIFYKYITENPELQQNPR